MAILNIVKDGDEILRKTSKEIDKIDDKLLTFIEDMKDTMEKAGGVGLAAVQAPQLRSLALHTPLGVAAWAFVKNALQAIGAKRLVDLYAVLILPGKIIKAKRALQDRLQLLGTALLDLLTREQKPAIGTHAHLSFLQAVV